MLNSAKTLNTFRVVGGVGTGKTEHLIDRINRLASNEATLDKTIVFCASPQAVQAFSSRLKDRLGDRSFNVSIITPRAFALEVLADDEARSATGRDPRLLASFEENFLLEDMKLSGMRPRRLKEMLKFFYRSWTELADDDESWLITGEEADTHSLLKANLAFTRSLLEPEVANLAVNFLRSRPMALDRFAYEHVLVDDIQCMSRASQQLARLLATRSLVVAGDEDACVEVYDSYPYVAGLSEFAEAYPQAQLESLCICHRSQATMQVANRLLADESMKNAVPLEMDAESVKGDVEVAVSKNPAGEFNRIADIISEAIDEGMPASSIAVAVPNAVWGRNVSSSLSARGVAVESLASPVSIRGDVRDNVRCTAARVMSILDLAVDPHDAVAWRCWCGYGDRLVNSATFASLRQSLENESIPLPEALRQLSTQIDGTRAKAYRATLEPRAKDGAERQAEPIVIGASRVADAYRAGIAILEAVKGLEGRELLDEITRLVTDCEISSAPHEIVQLCLGATGDTGVMKNETETVDGICVASTSAIAMRARARAALFGPILSGENAVVVLPYEMTVGFSPQLLIVAGFVNGFIPTRDYFDAAVTTLGKQQKVHAVNTRRLYSLVGKTGERLIFSYFKSTDLESAGTLKLKIVRIRLEAGVRMCITSPSDFLQTMIGSEA